MNNHRALLGSFCWFLADIIKYSGYFYLKSFHARRSAEEDNCKIASIVRPFQMLYPLANSYHIVVGNDSPHFTFSHIGFPLPVANMEEAYSPFLSSPPESNANHLSRWAARIPAIVNLAYVPSWRLPIPYERPWHNHLQCWLRLFIVGCYVMLHGCLAKARRWLGMVEYVFDNSDSSRTI